jgi:hypothetical protein
MAQEQQEGDVMKQPGRTSGKSAQPAGGIDIESTRSPEGQPACLITFGAWQGYASVADVRQTALDLVTCAAYAEMMMQLVDLGLPPMQTAAFVGDLLAKSGRRYFGTPETIYVMPAGSSKAKKAVVLLNRAPMTGPVPDDTGRIEDSMRGMLFADEAREMALGWLEVAEGTESDSLIERALPLSSKDGDLDHDLLFANLRKMRGLE